jgi:hypothetical protein
MHVCVCQHACVSESTDPNPAPPKLVTPAKPAAPTPTAGIAGGEGGGEEAGKRESIEGIRSVSDTGGQGGSVKCEGGVAGADGDRDEEAVTMTPCPVEVAHGDGGAMAGGEEAFGGEERGHMMDVDKGVDAAIQPKSVSLPKGDYGQKALSER